MSGAFTMGTMNILAAQVWHFWIAVLLVPAAIVAVIAVIVIYMTKVFGPRYPKR